ncbi:hypothetical protein CYMTET_44937 [Cymbomonas tetramitiformis]|uniref:Uncharacterized protein n=1 Tax=Cymbomonas tetramitiformis TaxID=36881 RepID=A0AAE0C0F6_9CHLO|nr:hypothetical protein CYMTET_44937 [Cymbomonas tetramitiformis]
MACVTTKLPPSPTSARKWALENFGPRMENERTIVLSKEAANLFVTVAKFIDKKISDYGDCGDYGDRLLSWR